MNRWTRLVLLCLAAGLSAPALAATYYVRPGGSDSCSGTTDADFSGSGNSCAWRNLDKCDTTLRAGDTCQVAGGTYAEQLRPANSGTSDTNRITYVCPSRACSVSTSSGSSLDLKGRSWILVDGFTFQNGLVEPWGGSSTGNLLDNVRTDDPDSAPPYAKVFTGGGSDNTIRNFDLYLPPDNVNKADVMAIGANAPGTEYRTLVANGTIRGGWNGLALQSCTDCTLDGIRLTGSKNHTLYVGAGNGLFNLVIKNSVLFASTGFREPVIHGAPMTDLKLLNNAFISGFLLPAIGYESRLSGRITIRNNIFFNAGKNSGESLGAVNNDNSLTWDIDYNAYVGAGNFGSSTPFWKDLRGSKDNYYYADVDADGTVDHVNGSDFDDWQALGFDRNSVVIANTDYRSSAAGYAGPLWGAAGPFWGAMVECSVDRGSFDTHSQWGEAIALGDFIEYEWDGTQREVSWIENGGGGNCARRIYFSPMLEGPPRAHRWFLSWGITPGLNKTFTPQPGSKIIDAGDNANCAHTIKGSRCDIGPVEYDPTGGDTQPPTTPTNLSATPGTTTVDLSWTASSDNTGVTGYDVLRSTTQGNGYTKIGVSATTSYSDGSGSPATTYYYVVKAYDAAGNRSGNSNEASALFPGTPPDTQPPTAPTNLTATPNSTKIDLAWTASTDNVGVTGYEVFRSTTAGSGHSKIGQTAATTFSDTTAAQAVRYYYVVKAYDAAGNRSGNSNEANALLPDTTPPTAPTNLTATAGTTTVGLTWSPSTDNVGVTGYDVLRSTASGNGYARIGQSIATSYTDTTGTPGTRYYYVVQATDAAGNRSANSNEATAVYPGTPPDTQPPTPPTNLTATPGAVGNNVVNLSWSPSTDNVGVTGYQILRSIQQGAGHTVIGQSATTSYSDTTGQAGATYYYIVRGYDAAGNFSGDSNEAAGTFPPPDTTPPSPPANLSAVQGPTSINLTWLPSTDNVGVTGYDVLRSTTAGSGHAKIGETAGTTWSDASGQAGVTYHYVTRAFDAAGNRSGNSNEASAEFPQPPPDSEPPTAPTNLVATPGTLLIRLTWNPSADNVGVTGYRVFRSLSPVSGYAEIGQSATTSYTDTGLDPAVTYHYRVYAHDAMNNLSGASNTASGSPSPDTTPPSRVTGLTALAGEMMVTLSWNPATDNIAVTGYRIHRSTSRNAGFSPIAETAATGYVDRAVVGNTTYYYRVAALDGAGNKGEDSSEVSARPSPGPDTSPPTTPANLQASSRPNGIALSWEPSTDNVGVPSYEIFRSVGSGSAYGLLDTAGSNAYTDGSAREGTTYYYKVRALDAAGNRSAFSNESWSRRNEFIAVSSTPSDGSSDVPSPEEITVRFSEQLDDRSLKSSGVYVVEVATGKPVEQAAASPRLEPDGRTVTIVPRHPLYTARQYRIEVVANGKGPRSLAGLRITSPYSATFTTGEETSNAFAPFETASIYPPPDARDVSTDAHIAMEFLSEVRVRSVKKKTIKLIGPTGTKIKLAGSPEFSPDGKSFTWRPLYPLATGATYEIRVKAGKKGVRGANGQPLPEPIVVRFTTTETAATTQMELGVAD